MPLEHEVVQWAKTRVPWQQQILRRTARGDTLTDSDYHQIVDSILAENVFGDDQLTLEDLPVTVEGDDAVRLVSVKNPERVNALASAEPLTFAPDGITIIYGDNAAGKSGYARLLKRIARARHQEEILSDVFQDTGRIEPNAQIAIQIGDREELFDRSTLNLPELQRMLFYDSKCGSAYIGNEYNFPYRPAALFVMDKLIDACVAVSSVVDLKLVQNSAARRRLPEVEDLVADTHAGRFLTNLTGTSSAVQLDALIDSIGETVELVPELKEQEALLIAGDSRHERQRLKRNAEKLDSLAGHLEQIQSALAANVVSEIESLRDRVLALERATSMLAQAFESEPLAGVGSLVWRELWQAAKRFSESHAYPSDEFPFVGSDSRCVLCHQTLSDEGRSRFARFDEFVRNDTQQQLVQARQEFDGSMERISKLAVQSDAVESNLLDLVGSYSKLVSETQSALSLADEVRTSLAKAMSDAGEFPSVDIEFSSLVVSLRESAIHARTGAQELVEPDAVAKRLHAIKKRRVELELLHSMQSQRDSIVEEISRLFLRAKLEHVKNSAATGAITRKISELAEAEVTEVIRDRFTRETDRLQLDRITITKTRADRTALLHQPKLVGARQRVSVPQVFSEGEKTALGLAAFFTEAYLDASKSALILDDPVTSLDHVRRGLVANRLVELGQDRQVVVFTHDVSLVADIKREARGKGVRVTDRSVLKSRGAGRKPGTCSTKHPWKAKDVSQRLQVLREDLSNIEKDSPQWDDDRYEKEVAEWSGSLSETWERIFSQELVGPLVANGGLEVRPNMSKILVQFSERDDREFQASYSRISQWAKRHDKSGMVNYVAPDVSLLKREVALVADWFQRVKGYKKQ